MDWLLTTRTRCLTAVELEKQLDQHLNFHKLLQLQRPLYRQIHSS
ncbi:unnamed protein product [Haemonchus placei]|uniref:Transposase n=1 Tax=Haemonchus placei TaxID=6290 RepID=A0A0N4VTM8_HAEPC|nr:unnamed protein product [Haemonchus placei]